MKNAPFSPADMARRTFRFSILHLALLFAALLVDHYLMAWLT